MASMLDSHGRAGRAYREALPFLGPVRPDVEVLAIAVLVLCPLVQNGLAEGHPVLPLDVLRGEDLVRVRVRSSSRLRWRQRATW